MKKEQKLTEKVLKSKNGWKLSAGFHDHMGMIEDMGVEAFEKGAHNMAINTLKSILKFNYKPHPQFDYSSKKTKFKNEGELKKFLQQFKNESKNMLKMLEVLSKKPSKAGITSLVEAYIPSWNKYAHLIAKGEYDTQGGGKFSAVVEQKLTKQKLKEIIKEEIQNLNEGIDLSSHVHKVKSHFDKFESDIDYYAGGSFDSDSVEYEKDIWQNNSKILKSRDKKLGQWEKKVKKSLDSLMKDYRGAWK